MITSTVTARLRLDRTKLISVTIAKTFKTLSVDSVWLNLNTVIAKADTLRLNYWQVEYRMNTDNNIHTRGRISFEKDFRRCPLTLKGALYLSQTPCLKQLMKYFLWFG